MVRPCVLPAYGRGGEDQRMEKDEFVEKLISQISLDAIDFASDVERVLAEEVKYLRRLIAVYEEGKAAEKSRLVKELRARLADKQAQVDHLVAENQFLRQVIAARGLK